MAFVPLTLATGATILVQPETVDELQDVPLSLIITPPGPPCSYLSLLDGSRYVLTGTAAANAALLSAGGPGGATSGTFGPVFPTFGGLVSLIAAPLWRWHRIGSQVLVHGEASISLLPGPGSAFLEVTPPFPITGGTLAAVVATMVAVPSTPAPEAPVDPYTTAATVGWTLQVTGIYPTVRLLTSFMYETP